jgi:Pyridoxamine 5'-phosphate oxidase
MGKVYEGIDQRIERWIAGLPMFFVGTAPLHPDGHVNVSPKAPIETLRVLDAHTVAYLDLIGSGAETIAHLRENGRIVFMLCAFEGPPRIVRLHGRAEVLIPGDVRFDELLDRCAFAQPTVPEARRAIVLARIDRVADSCGYGVPLMTRRGSRPHLDAWAAKKVRTGGAGALLEYQREKNALSIDELPAVPLSPSGGARG